MDRLSRSIYELAVQNLMMYRILSVAFLLIARVKVTQSVFTRALTVSVSFDVFPNMSYVFLPMKLQSTLFLRPIKVKFVVQTYMGFIKGLYCIFSPRYTHFCNVCFSSKIYGPLHHSWHLYVEQSLLHSLFNFPGCRTCFHWQTRQFPL